MEQDYSFLNLLPKHVLCEIFTYPMTLHEFLYLRKQSTITRREVEACLEIITGDQGNLFPDLVMDLKRIRRISPDIPIIISNKADIVTLAQHPTLAEAAFDLTVIKDTSSIGDFTLSFFSNYSRANPNCEECQVSNKDYNFTFFYYDKNGEIHLIQITQGSLLFEGISSFQPHFAEKISKYVPICRLTTSLNPYLLHLDLPCLQELRLILMETVDLKGENYDDLATYITNIRIFYISYSKGIPGIFGGPPSNYQIFVTTLLRRLPKNPNITTFLPIPFNLDDIREAKERLPNLTSIWFTLSGFTNYLNAKTAYYIGNFIREVRQYPEIVLFNDMMYPRQREEYLNIFPKNLQERISFIESDWLL